MISRMSVFLFWFSSFQQRLEFFFNIRRQVVETAHLIGG